MIAANEGFIPGKVSLSVRTASDENILDFLAKYQIEGFEIGYSNEASASVILDKGVFDELLQRLGFGREFKISA